MRNPKPAALLCRYAVQRNALCGGGRRALVAPRASRSEGSVMDVLGTPCSCACYDDRRRDWLRLLALAVTSASYWLLLQWALKVWITAGEGAGCGVPPCVFGVVLCPVPATSAPGCGADQSPACAGAGKTTGVDRRGHVFAQRAARVGARARCGGAARGHRRLCL